jgi:hypothetical protein
MKKLLLCGVAVSVMAFSVSTTAFAGAAWWRLGVPMHDAARGFERIDHLHKFESMRYQHPKQWGNLKDDTLPNVDRLYTAGIFKKHYIKQNVPTLEVGVNFYHLSGADKRRAIISFNNMHNCLDNEASIINIVDGVTREIVGEYNSNGLFLQ